MKKLYSKTESFFNSIEGFNTEFTEKQQQVIIDAFNSFAVKVQEWVIEEFAPEVQEWIETEYTSSLRLTIDRGDKKDLTEHEITE